MGIGNSFPDAPSLSSPLHQCFHDRLGHSSSQFHVGRSRVLGRKGTPHQHSRDENDSVCLKHLPFQDCRRVNCAHE